MELQEIKRACHTRKGSLHESGGSKKKTNTEFSYVLACINIWVFGKASEDNGLGYLAAAVLVFALFWVLTGKNLPDRMAECFGAEMPGGSIGMSPECVRT